MSYRKWHPVRIRMTHDAWQFQLSQTWAIFTLFLSNFDPQHTFTLRHSNIDVKSIHSLSHAVFCVAKSGKCSPMVVVARHNVQHISDTSACSMDKKARGRKFFIAICPCQLAHGCGSSKPSLRRVLPFVGWTHTFRQAATPFTSATWKIQFKSKSQIKSREFFVPSNRVFSFKLWIRVIAINLKSWLTAPSSAMPLGYHC